MQLARERFECKTLEGMLERELCLNYSLSRIESKVLAQDVSTIMDSFNSDHLRPGQMLYSAVCAKEGPSKPVKECTLTNVILTIFQKEDTRQTSVSSMRQERITRITKEAFSQGALLSQEDISTLLCVDTRTIKRDIAHLKGGGLAIPTRGMVKDMGRGTTHKNEAIRLFMQGKQFSEITRELYHSPSSILRYLKAFILVSSLKEEGMSNERILTMNLSSNSLIEEYLALYDKHIKKNRDKLKELIKRAKIKKRGAQ